MPRAKGFQAAGKMRFLVLLPEMEKALSEERSLKGFYLANKERLKLSYSQVCHYAKVFGLREKVKRRQGELFGAEALPRGTIQPASPDSGAAKSYEPKQYKEESPKKGFHFDPMDAIRKKFT